MAAESGSLGFQSFRKEGGSIEIAKVDGQKPRFFLDENVAEELHARKR